MTAEQLNGNANPWQHHDAFLQSGQRIEVAPKDDHELGVVDPRNAIDRAPAYAMGTLPKVFEDYMMDNIAEYSGDPAAYACGFLAMHCSVLHDSVSMQTRPSKDNWREPNDHSLTLGKSGSNKSGLFKDLTKHQNEWHRKIRQAMPPRPHKRGNRPPVLFAQAVSAEGVFHVIANNKGERLLLANDEAMTFYMGTGSHHQGSAGTSMMTDAVCKMYDGDSYTKQLVKGDDGFDIPKCLGTLIMATVTEKLAGWDGFATMVTSGAMARTTVGLIGNPMPRDTKLHVEGADKAMDEKMLALRRLKDIRFVLAPDAAAAWSDFIDAKEQRNAELDERREDEGFTAWSKKYDTRIMSMAVVLQAYQWTEGNMLDYEPYDIPKTAADDDKVGGGEARQGKRVSITFETLERAIDFVEGFLAETQKYFYKMAEGISEFGPELLNWVARVVVTHNPGEPNILTRNDLTYRGPNSVRPTNGVTPALKEKQNRWVRTLLDYGYIEVFDKPGEYGKYKPDEQRSNFRIRPQFFQKFDDPATRQAFQAHDAALQQRLTRNLGPLRLRKKPQPPEKTGTEA